MTKYQVLREVVVANITAYEAIGQADGHNDNDAVSNFLEAGDNGETFGEGAYRAVPARSWRPEPIIKKKKISFA